MLVEDLKPKKKIIFSVLTVIIICTIIISAFLMLAKPKYDENVNIIDISITPENPGVDDVVTLSLHLDGKPKYNPEINIVNLFSSIHESTGSFVSMSKSKNNTFVSEIGPFSQETQIWYMLIFDTNDGLIYNESTIDIGIVNYSDDIRIFNVDYNPKELKNISSVEITANVEYLATITEPFGITKVYKTFYPNGVNGGSIGGEYGWFNETSGFQELKFEIPRFDYNDDNEILPSGSLIFYRLIVNEPGYKYATPPFIIQIP